MCISSFIAQSPEEIARKYSIRTLPKQYFSVTDNKGHLLNDSNQVYALSFALKNRGYWDPGYETCSNNLARKEIYSCHNVMFLRDSFYFRLDYSKFKELREWYPLGTTANIMENVFRNATHLRCASIRAYDKFPQSLCNLKELEYLEVNQFIVTNIVGDCVKELPALKYIKVSRPDSSLVQAIFSNPSLEVIEIHDAPYVDIPPSVAQLTHLKQLSLINCGDISIPSELYASDSLLMLQIEGASSVRFPENQSGFRSLKAISIEQSTQTPHFPMFSPENQLEVLDYHFYKEIDSVNMHLSNLHHLKRCHLWPDDLLKNRFYGTHLPIGIENLVELEELYLNFDNRDQLPSEIIQLKNLRRLYIVRIKNGLDLQLLDNLPSLKELGLASMYLEEDSPIHQDLSTMKLKYNVIEYTPFEITCFDYYPALIRDRIVLPLRY